MKARLTPKRKEELINELWRQLTEKISSEWSEKYHTYGTDIHNVESSTNFAKAVHNDIYKSFKEKGTNVAVVNHLTLHNYFKQRGLSVNTKAGTLDLFCFYLGYKRWTDFIEKNEHLPIFSPSQTSDQENTVDHTTNLLYSNPSSAKKNSWIVVFLISLAAFAYFYTHSIPLKTKIQFTKTEKKAFQELITNANKLEFKLYQSVPNIKDTFLLNQYFMEDSSAKSSILGVLNRAIRNNRKLRTPPSAFDLLKIDFIEKSATEAVITTEEKWHILWYDQKSNKDERLYDKVNEQRYFLAKENNQWKIQANVYEGSYRVITE